MKSYFLAAASGMLGVMVGAALFAPERAEAERTDEPARFGHIVAERVDIVEPDGTLRQAIYSKARDPGIVVRGQNYRHPSRTQSGMLFYNDEGTEVGGLVYAGETKADGTRSSGGSLTFDAYEQDQIVQVVGVREGDRQYSGVFVNDRPSQSMNFALMDRIARETDPAKQEALIAQVPKDGGAPRGFFGRWHDGDAAVTLRDGEGRARLEMRVSEAGEARIVFLDAEGEVVRTIGAAE